MFSKVLIANVFSAISLSGLFLYIPCAPAPIVFFKNPCITCSFSAVVSRVFITCNKPVNDQNCFCNACACLGFNRWSKIVEKICPISWLYPDVGASRITGNPLLTNGLPLSSNPVKSAENLISSITTPYVLSISSVLSFSIISLWILCISSTVISLDS